MPYISKTQREQEHQILDDIWCSIDENVEKLVFILNDLPDGEKEGCANYIISRIVAGGLKPAGGWRYMWLNRAYGTFLSAANEFNRRVMIPYENKCIKKSGDIPEYEEFPVE